ncbi:Hypothetical protein A7A1_3018 [Bacillus subtilis subsp. subtilis str. BSP1]|nr:Hypothetical protein A7A1_3018 [Bacillus subtilis subsp. subtilis str. BSP1]
MHSGSSSFSHPDFHCRLQLKLNPPRAYAHGSRALKQMCFTTAGRDFHPAPKDTIFIHLSLLVIIAILFKVRNEINLQFEKNKTSPFDPKGDVF